jgi:hypothetical protein
VESDPAPAKAAKRISKEGWCRTRPFPAAFPGRVNRSPTERTPLVGGVLLWLRSQSKVLVTPLILLPHTEGKHFSHAKPTAGQPDPNGTANHSRISTPEHTCHVSHPWTNGQHHPLSSHEPSGHVWRSGGSQPSSAPACQRIPATEPPGPRRPPPPPPLC